MKNVCFSVSSSREEYGMARVWAADADQNVVLPSQIPSYVALAFASVLATNQHIYQSTFGHT